MNRSELESTVTQTLDQTMSAANVCDLTMDSRDRPRIGVDVVDVRRIRAALERWQVRFTDRFFTADERQYCSGGLHAGRRYAGIFAAKEAVYKALGLSWDRAFSWKWIEIVHGPNRAPIVVLADPLKAAWPFVEAQAVSVSVSHLNEIAVATAVASQADGEITTS